MEVIRKRIKRKWAFSNMVSMVRFHLMNYIKLIAFLNKPEKAWSEQNKEQNITPDLFNSSA